MEEKQSKYITITLTENLYNQIKADAEEEERTTSQYIRIILKRYYKDKAQR